MKQLTSIYDFVGRRVTNIHNKFHGITVIFFNDNTYAVFKSGSSIMTTPADTNGLPTTNSYSSGHPDACNPWKRKIIRLADGTLKSVPPSLPGIKR